MTQTDLEHLTVKTTLYTLKTYPWGPNFRPFCSTANRFRDTRSPNVENAQSIYPWVPNLVRFALQPAVSKISHILSFPIDSHVKRPKTEQKKCQKAKIWNFTILYTILVETLPRSMHEFLEVNVLYTFRQDAIWSFFLPYGPMLTKTKKKWQKIQNLKFHQSLYNFSRDPS